MAISSKAVPLLFSACILIAAATMSAQPLTQASDAASHFPLRPPSTIPPVPPSDASVSGTEQEADKSERENESEDESGSDIDGVLFHGHKPRPPKPAAGTPIPIFPPIDPLRFPGKLSPLAFAVYQRVTEIAFTHPANTPLLPSMIGTSGRVIQQLAAYGNTDAFVRQVFGPAIERARQEVLISTLILDPTSTTGKGIRDAIVALSNRLRREGAAPVVVNIAADSIANTFFNGKAPNIKALFKSRVEISPAFFNLPSDTALSHVELRVKNYHLNTLGALHSKMIIVDGKTFITGSKNLDGDGPMEFVAEMEGPIALTARHDFEAIWGERLALRPHELQGSRTRPVQGDVPMLNVGTVEGAHLTSKSGNNPQDVAWLTLLAHAHSEVLIHTPNFVATVVANAVLDAVRRGIKVTIIEAFHQQDTNEKINPFTLGDNDDTARWMYKKLRGDPAATERLQVCWYIGTRVKAPRPLPSITEWAHIKAMFVDQKVTMFGTGNQDPQSWYNSRENNVLIDDAGVTKSFLRTILETQQSLKYCSHAE